MVYFVLILVKTSFYDAMPDLFCLKNWPLEPQRIHDTLSRRRCRRRRRRHRPLVAQQGVSRRR